MPACIAVSRSNVSTESLLSANDGRSSAGCRACSGPLGTQGAFRARVALAVEVVQHRRQTLGEHLGADGAKELGHEVASGPGEAGVVVGEASSAAVRCE